MTTNQVLIGIGLILVLAVGSQVLASRLKIPALIILLPAARRSQSRATPWCCSARPQAVRDAARPRSQPGRPHRAADRPARRRPWRAERRGAAGAARRPDGDAVQFDVRDGAANPVFTALRELGLDRDAVICVERVDATLTGQAARAAARRAAAGDRSGLGNGGSGHPRR